MLLLSNLLGWENCICSFCVTRFGTLTKHYDILDSSCSLAFKKWYKIMKPLLPNAEQRASNVSVTETEIERKNDTIKDAPVVKFWGQNQCHCSEYHFGQYLTLIPKFSFCCSNCYKNSKSNQSLQKSKWTILSHSANQTYSIYETNSKGALWSFCVVLDADRYKRTPFLH